jgi:hypothetical protein
MKMANSCMSYNKPRPSLFSIILIIIYTAQAATVPTNFKWRAHLNRFTGIATSCEESTVIFPSVPSSRQLTQHQITQAASKFIQDYPNFLSRSSLTLGLLQTKHVLDKQSSDLCTRIYPLNVLSFGYPKHTSKRVCNRIIKRYSGDDNTIVTIVCSLEIPILGGLLSQSSDGGCLRFTLLRNESDRAAMLITEIDGPYKPSLAGTSIPRSRIKSALYCVTQRMFHEYVMWRFHRLFAIELNDNFKKNKEA